MIRYITDKWVATVKTHRLFFMTLLVVMGMFWYGFTPGQLYGAIDAQFSELSNGSDFQEMLFWWSNTRGVGEVQSNHFPHIYALVWVRVLRWIFHDPFLVNFLKIYIPNVVFFVCTYAALYSLRHVFGSYIARRKTLLVVLSLFSVINLYFLQSNYFVLFIQRYTYIIFCLFLVCINRVVYKKQGHGWLLVVYILSVGSWFLFPYWLPYLALLGAYTVYLFHRKDITRRQLLFFWLVYVLINAPSIGSLVYFVINTQFATSHAIAYAEQVFAYANSQSYLANTFAFIGGVNWADAWPWNDQAVYPFAYLFEHYGVFRCISYIPFSLFLLSLTFFEKKRDTFGMGLLGTIIILLFFIVANNPPFGHIYSFGFEHSIWFKIYRESHNKVYPAYIFLLLVYSIRYLDWERLRKHVVFVGMLLVYFLTFGYVIMTFSFYDKGSFFSLPRAYVDAALSIEPDATVLILPEYQQLKQYEYGHYGVTPFQNLLSNPMLLTYEKLESSYNDIFFSRVLEVFSKKRRTGPYVYGSTNPSFDERVLDRTTVDYIILDGYVRGFPPYYQEDFLKTKEALDLFSDFQPYRQFDKIHVYKRTAPTYPRVLSAGAMFWQQNPSTYVVRIQHLQDVQPLVLLQSFHPGWGIHLKRSEDALSCINSILYNDQTTWRCQKPRQLFSVDTWQALRFRSAFDDTHEVWDEYANAWTIDAKMIVDMVPSEYYTRNDDGSIDVTFVVSFRPQSYFTMLLFISLGTGLGLCGLWCIFWVSGLRNKEKKLSNKKK